MALPPIIQPLRPFMTVREDRFRREGGSAPQSDKAEIRVVTVELADGKHRGRGECTPYARYGETVEEIIDTLLRLSPEISGGLSRRGLQRLLPAGAARNALDCALWDFDAKRTATSAWQIAGMETPHRLVTAYGIPSAAPEAMAAMALREAHRPAFKLLLDSGDGGDVERIAAIRAALPDVRILVDARESWTAAQLGASAAALGELGVELLEQPLPAGADGALAGISLPVPVCADESCNDSSDLARISGIYDAVKIKLDKTGGLTEALALAAAARDAGMRIAIGGLPASSLGVAPALVLAQEADWIDLDTPLHLANDRQPGLRFEASFLYPASVSLWG
jgi:L-alanine-DL-glutamate epimerase-like enolase superfamily enzyme